jgi:hypothetical protein
MLKVHGPHNERTMVDRSPYTGRDVDMPWVYVRGTLRIQR